MKTSNALLFAALGGALLGLGTFVACNGLLGIEPATLGEAGAAEDAGPTTGDDGSAMGDAPAGPGDDSAAGDDGDPLTCANYCAVVMQACTGTSQEYLSNAVCMALCKYMQPGVYYPPSATPDNVDTLGCRLWYAGVAAQSPDSAPVQCRPAGPLGADLCGGPCKPFCSLDWHYCTDDNAIDVYDGGEVGCRSVCGSDAGYGYVEGESGDLVDPAGDMIEMGNTLNCRLWHLETAIFESLPETHCPHTELPSSVCQ